MEGHLHMPFVHWLPKNKLRELLISLFVRIGREPHWAELEGHGAKRKIATYYAYSVEHTFYRKPMEIASIFKLAAFDASFETINHPRVARHPVLGPMTRVRPLRAVLDYLLVNLVNAELHLKR